MNSTQTCLLSLTCCILGCLFISPQANAQIANGTLYVTNQAQIDTLPYYEGIAGSLIIGRLDTTKPKTNITDLSRFRRLKWVLGNLTIYRNGQLHDLHGLDSLDEAGYTEITIEANDSLRTLEGLGRLKKTGESVDFQINFNPMLENLHGLEGIDSLSHNFYIQGNAKLKNLEGLSNIKYIESFRLYGYSSNALESLYGLNPQVQIQDLIIGEPNLQNLTGLDIANIQNNLAVIFSGIKDFTTTTNSNPTEKPRFVLTLYNNPMLQSLQGLNLYANRGWVDIHGNPQLQDITLDQVAFGWPEVHIYDNPALQHLSFASMRLIKQFWLDNNDSLLVLDCFPVLDSIKGEQLYLSTGTDNRLAFFIRNNERLRAIHFPNLLAYGSPDMLNPYYFQSMSIGQNPQLEEVTFPRLETILYKKPTFYVGFYIYANPLLHRLEMPNLITVNFGSIKIDDAALELLDGFDRMERGGLIVGTCPRLKVISTFEQLKMAYELQISGDSLRQLPDFLRLDTIGQPNQGAFTNISAGQMKKWPAFPHLTADYSYRTRYFGNDSLQTTMTFPALKRVYHLTIASNERLLSLDGFSALEKVNIKFIVQNNAQLADCSAICAMLAAGVPPTVFQLHNNAMECDTLPAVLTYCDTISVALGEPFSTNIGPLSALQINPNPATGLVRFGWEGVPLPDVRFDWILSNIQGKVLQRGGYGLGQTDFSVAAYPSGLYFLALHDPASGAVVTRRLGVLRP